MQALEELLTRRRAHLPSARTAAPTTWPATARPSSLSAACAAPSSRSRRACLPKPQPLILHAFVGANACDSSCNAPVMYGLQARAAEVVAHERAVRDTQTQSKHPMD